MHPDMMREVARQRIADRREEASRINLARAMRKAMRQRARARDSFVPPPIPDYVDGTFREAGVSAERAGTAR